MPNVNQRRTPAVYALHLGDHRYRYVGSTTKNSDNRLYEHIYRANSGHPSPVYAWMREVGVRNVRVSDLIRVTDPTDLPDLEICAIVQLLGEGFDLVNRTWSKGRGYEVRSNEYRRDFRRTPELIGRSLSAA